MRRVLLFAVPPLSLLLSPLAILYTFTSIDRYGYTYAQAINDRRLRA